ncbi:hypothetical protein ACO1PK_04640 [Alishewanella sp. d11]|uniref:hypothetical protein n=1 Tax=Alishewanella sp. d11 TaxID=3414030 RepID=UPI003BF88C59
MCKAKLILTLVNLNPENKNTAKTIPTAIESLFASSRTKGPFSHNKKHDELTTIAGDAATKRISKKNNKKGFI